MKKLLTLFTIIYSLFTITSCSFVFSGGAGGHIVDAESTSNPKSGIANVDVYAYTSSSERDSDFRKWNGTDRFQPSSSYYAHTTTDNDGNFRLSKIVWETKKSSFGKDADISHIYLIFYHENFGLEKGDTLIVSDSTSDTIYQEMTKIKTTTNINLSFIDAANGNPTGNNVLATILVPEDGLGGKAGSTKKYTATINGNGTVQVSYPRYLSEADKSSGTENSPEITISYSQSSDTITWKACYNGDGPSKTNADGTANENGGYDFYKLEENSFKRKISGTSFNLSFYGKTTKLSIPVISGRYDSTNSTDGLGKADDDGIIISMKAKGSGNDFSINCGETTTGPETIGTGGTQSHGNFSGLGQGITWDDESYTGKYASTELKFSLRKQDGTEITIPSGKETLTVRSNVPSYNVKL